MMLVYIISGVTDRGARERAAPLAKLNVKTGAPLADILLFCILLSFVRLFFSFFREFSFF